MTSTVATTEAQMKEVSKSCEPHVFAGAGHGFLRAQDDLDGANRKATSEAWPRTIIFRKAQLEETRRGLR